MNIQEAKMEVIHTVRAYTARDAGGEYRIPRLRQRPVLLMGPPGIGKTAIVEQAARECGVGLVSYTITHHTRQSAVGLPMVEHKIYDGREVTVTEYTMSEIIASVYECMESTGCREGILFIDEVNCVSETLAPTMLQFLQGKTFGNHRVPRGWVIVAAGNPPEYNKSVREFDIVTLDRVKKIDVDVDYPAWKLYAADREIHGAIRSYLESKPQYFYRIQQTPGEKEFVTARGWEDLSVILRQYEEMDVKINEGLIRQYLQCREISEDFASYYRFYQSCGKKYGESLEEILESVMESAEKTESQTQELLKSCPLDEQLTIANLLTSQVLNHVAEWRKANQLIKRMEEAGQLCKEQMERSGKNESEKSGKNESGEMKSGEMQMFYALTEDFFKKRTHALEVKEETETISEEEACLERQADRELKEIFAEIRESDACSWEEAWQQFSGKMQERNDDLERDARRCAREMDRMLGWLEKMYGRGTAFLSAMETFTANTGCMELIRQQGCPIYEENCGELMTLDRERQLRRKVDQMQSTELFGGMEI